MRAVSKSCKPFFNLRLPSQACQLITLHLVIDKLRFWSVVTLDHPGYTGGICPLINMKKIMADVLGPASGHFTGNFQLARIRAELEKLREKSENIAQLLAR